MTTYYSDHFTTGGLSTDSFDNQIRVSAGVGHSRLRYKRGRITTHATTFASTDTARILTMRSSARLIELLISTDGAASNGTVDVGVFLSGTNHDGASIGTATVNLFADALALTTLGNRTSIFGAEAGSSSVPVAGEECPNGTTMWELVNMGDGAYTSDPEINFDITLLPTVTFNAATIITLEAYYTAGD